MKKILLGTSALIGAALLASAASAGEDPKVTIGGFSTFEAGYSDSDFDSGERNRAFRNDNEIHFNIAGKTDAGLGYGAEIDLQADIDGGNNQAFGTSGTTATPGSTNSGIVAHRTYGWVQGDMWGHLEFGSNDGVARTMKVDASNIARATGGIDGDYKYFSDANTLTTGVGTGAAGTFTGLGAGNFITAPRLPIEHGPANGFASDLWGNDNKITYYTPRFSGFQLGVSYAPDLANRGQLTNRIQNLPTGFTAQDIVEGGVNYENQFDQIGFAAAATGEVAKVGNPITGGGFNDLRAWNAGAKVTFAGFSLAGSYGDWDDSFDVNGTNAYYYTAGLAYEAGPLGASVTYLNSDNKGNGGQDNKFQDISVGVDYKLAPGLTPFAEYTYYDIDPSNVPNGENQGNVVIIGSELSF